MWLGVKRHVLGVYVLFLVPRTERVAAHPLPKEAGVTQHEQHWCHLRNYTEFSASRGESCEDFLWVVICGAFSFLVPSLAQKAGPNVMSHHHRRSWQGLGC